ncbi:MAG: LamG domain-containing protein, partial [Thermoanaerobaculia bacterium]|nr:LamG domain-containing protein [Thermoanaerobaculia bacterium]
EELGAKSFDIINRTRLYFCNATFNPDRPPVRVAGITNEDGFYRIESANYGTGTTFLAEPMKSFYKHRALKFDRDQSDYATLPNFPVTPKSTLELWVNSAGPEGDQVLLSKRWGGANDFRLLLREEGVNNRIFFQLNGGEADFGLLDNNYQHLAFTIESGGANTIVTAYKGGQFIGSASLPPISGTWSDAPAEPWTLGARKSGVAYTDFYGGLIDEVALYDTTLAQTVIQSHANNSRDPQERGLRIYFALDEGSGNRLNNAGSYLSGNGTAFGTEWSALAPNQVTTPRVFAPKTRQVTLNPSVTSVDQVDFTDRSTIAVSGFVRYEGTDCFVNRAEILVNGESFKPKIFTDSLGRFTIDFEPGTTATLSVVYENHNFIPAIWDIVNLTSPLAGVLFNDVTKRKIKGQIAGGNCRKSIINGPVDDCRLTVRTLDGCFERTDTVQVENGIYELANLPPLEVTIAVSKHNNPKVYQFFQIEGGRRLDLTDQDSSGVDFIYFAPPSVDVAGFDNFYKICQGDSIPIPDDDGNPLIVIEEGQMVKLDVTVYEQYGPGQAVGDRCLLDSAGLKIDNTFDLAYDFLEPLDTTMYNKKFDYDFVAANPNPDNPYLQIMQITADVDGRKGTYIRRAMITGIIKGDKKFTTVSPMVPMFVLRDPPGDGSSAYLEKGETICNTIVSENSGGGGPFFTLDVLAGPEAEVSFPFSTTIKGKALFGVTSEFASSIIKTTNTSLEYCLTATERIATDDGDLVVGGKTSLDGGQTILAGNDVYVGTAFNFIISDSRYLRFNDTTCNVVLNSVTTLESDTFATNYIYSEWNIENNVIRYLDSLILDGQDPDSINSKSKQRWLDFIKMNTEAKAKATYKRNISWDAGVQYEYSETRDTTQEASSDVTKNFEGLLGFATEFEAASGAGLKLALKIGGKFEGSVKDGTGQLTQKGITVGYTLKDDDPGDTWTMDVKDDPIFKTPVFEIKAGQTSCPWEVGTARREGVKLISVDGNTRLNVPSNGIASFKFMLNNNSQTGETFTYAFTAGPESNPDGAIIRVNGAPLIQNILYAIPWGEQVPITVTVERGPTAYLYEGLEVVLFSQCHDVRANGLGFAPDNDPILYSAVYLTVQFEEPCSEVDISFPQNGWVIKPDPVNQATQDILPITISGYDKTDADLLGVRLQYRPTDGDGAWINITGGNPDYIPKADLGETFEVYFWNTGGTPPLADGSYEIRAIALCNGAPTDNPGISHVITGRIERQPPALVGLPEPSDGVYNVGDEISFTFNKPVNCNKLIEADIFNANNVGLYNTTTGKLINVNISCYENKIVLEPEGTQNEFLENVILRAELHDIEDKTGNNSPYFKWEFYVDRNELAWLTDSLGLTKYEDETKTVSANIHNRGGYPVPFKILNVPDWVHVVPNQGTLAPNEIRPVSFTADSTLAFGHWADSVVLHTETGQNPFFMGGDEGLPVGVRVVCRPPFGPVNGALYENSMIMVLRLNIEGEFSTDVEDMVAAYIDDELRGAARVQYVPQVDAWLAYLNVYGDPSDMLAPIRIDVWDASKCQRYSPVLESFSFQPDNVIGKIEDPQLI